MFLFCSDNNEPEERADQDARHAEYPGDSIYFVDDHVSPGSYLLATGRCRLFLLLAVTEFYKYWCVFGFQRLCLSRHVDGFTWPPNL